MRALSKRARSCCATAAVVVGGAVTLPVAGASATTVPASSPLYTGAAVITFFDDPLHAENYRLTGVLPISGTSAGIFSCTGYSTCDWSFTPATSTSPTGSGQCAITYPASAPFEDPEVWSGSCTGSDSGNAVSFTWTATVEADPAGLLLCGGLPLTPLLGPVSGCTTTAWDGVYEASTGS